jgi:hypothetical protein
MRSFVSLLPLAGSLALFSEAKPVAKPLVTFTSPGTVSPEAVHNIHVEYAGEVDGELTITYGSCDDALVSRASQRIGTTHVGAHPLAARHIDHENQRPTKFVWMTPSDMPKGCLQAFLDDELVGKSDELVISKKLARRSEKTKSFADVAGDEGLWFNGVAYLQQKQPDDVFVATAKSKCIGILGGGISGLTSSVSSWPPLRRTVPSLTFHLKASVRLCGRSQVEDPRVF